LELIIDSGPSRWHNNLKDPLINLLIWFLEKKDVVYVPTSPVLSREMQPN
jgi:hypothetical protein